MEILNESVESFEKLYLQLQNSYPIIVPTDTNYNLCSLPNNKICIDRIFKYKSVQKTNRYLYLLMNQKTGNYMEKIKM